VLQIWQHFTVTIAWALLACVGLMLAMVTGVEGAPAAQIQGHRQTLAPPSRVFFLAAIRISSGPHPFYAVIQRLTSGASPLLSGNYPHLCDNYPHVFGAHPNQILRAIRRVSDHPKRPPAK
jgi:hypothetical protein